MLCSRSSSKTLLSCRPFELFESPLLPRKTRSPPPRQDDPQQVHQDSSFSFGDPHKKNQKHPQSDIMSGLNWAGTLYQRIRLGTVSQCKVKRVGNAAAVGNDSLICPLWHLLFSQFPCFFLSNVGGICIKKKRSTCTAKKNAFLKEKKTCLL